MRMTRLKTTPRLEYFINPTQAQKHNGANCLCCIALVITVV